MSSEEGMSNPQPGGSPDPGQEKENHAPKVDFQGEEDQDQKSGEENSKRKILKQRKNKSIKHQAIFNMKIQDQIGKKHQAGGLL